MVTASAPKDSATVAVLVVSTSANEISASTTPMRITSLAEMRPLVSGRWAVRSTWRSKSLSAKSLTAQPALRIRMVPAVKTASRCQPGKPCAAIHKAIRVGHKSSSQP